MDESQPNERTSVQDEREPRRDTRPRPSPNPASLGRLTRAADEGPAPDGGSAMHDDQLAADEEIGGG